MDATTRLHINLLPAEYRSHKADLSWILDRRVVWSTVCAIVVALAISGLQTDMATTISSAETELLQAQADVRKVKPILDTIKVLEQQMQVVNQKQQALKSIQVSKKRWVILFEDISAVMPPNMWVDAISQLDATKLEIRGSTWNFSEIADYMIRLEGRDAFTGVQLLNITTTKRASEDAFNFVLQATTKQDLGLETEGK